MCMTLPNILKNFNPYLYGYSTGSKGVRSGSQVALNFAETGATSDKIVDQARRLVRKMRRDPYVNLRKDWKMVTVLVGHNDLCSHTCSRIGLLDDVYDATPSYYLKNIRKALDILYRNLPRTFVNLLPVAGKKQLIPVSGDARRSKD